MTSTARQLRQPPTIEAIERVPYFADMVPNYMAYHMLLLNIITIMENSCVSYDF